MCQVEFRSDYPSEGSPAALPTGALPQARTSLRAAAPPADLPDGERLFEEFAPLVRRLIRQYGADDAEMRQDLPGEVYWRFRALLTAYDPSRGIPLRPYLVRQLSLSVHTYARRQWRSRRREVRLGEGEGALRPPVLADPSGEWDERMVRAQVRGVLPAAIERLPCRQRQVVLWRYYEGRSFEEIAGLLSVQPATARSLLRHGLNHLREWVSARPVPAA